MREITFKINDKDIKVTGLNSDEEIPNYVLNWIGELKDIQFESERRYSKNGK